jgi:DNA (cytosine-5)-methyltransferase 1
VLREKKPAYLLLENVPGLLSHDDGRTFAAILNTLCQLGYGVEWQVLNSKDFGVPQSRRRVYLIGYLNRGCAGEILPIRDANTKTLIQVIGGRQGRRIYDPSGLSCTLKANSGDFGGKTGLYAVAFNRKYGVTKEIDTAYALLASDYRGLNRNNTQNAVLNIKEATTRGYKEAVPGDSVNLSYANQNKKRGRVGKAIANTIDTGSQQGVVTLTGRIRRLMLRECFRLQGFTDDQIDKLLDGGSDTQAYKQAGNAVTVNVVHALGLRLKDVNEAACAATRAQREAA